MNAVTPLKPTIVITSKDRCDDLRAALKSCISQTVKSEIIVIDDASTDGTAEMVRKEFLHQLLLCALARRGGMIAIGSK